MDSSRGRNFATGVRDALRTERKALLDAMAHLDQVGSLYVPDGWDEFTLQNERSLVDENGKQRSRPQNLEYYFRPYVCWTNNSLVTAHRKQRP